MNTILTPALINRCQRGSKAKGFWDIRPDPRQQLMLCVSELCEALEAHRADKQVSKTIVWDVFEANRDKPDVYAAIFKAHIKDTVSDEMADAYIRLCDFIGGFGLDQDIIVEGVEHDRKQGVEPMAYSTNFAANLLRATSWIVGVAQAEDNDDGSDYPFVELPIRGALSCIEDICDLEAIDLGRHIDLKLRYNATRDKMHGKAY